MVEIQWRHKRAAVTTPVIPRDRVPPASPTITFVAVDGAVKPWAKRPEPGSETISDSIDAILKETAIRYGITVFEMMGESRHHISVKARHEALWRIRMETGLSASKIGRMFKKDHTTVIHAVNKHEERIAEWQSK